LNYYLWSTTNKIWTNSFDSRIVELIERGAEIDFINLDGGYRTTPLLNASGMLENLKEQYHYTDEEIEAYELEAVKIVKYLAEKGANVHALNRSHQNALHLAAMGGRDKVVPVLADLGVDINQKDSIFWQNTPLILAIGAGDLATVKALVKAGADINLCSAFGNTPLDWAVGYSKAITDNYPYHNQKEILEYLLSLGAKSGKKDFQGWAF